MSEELSIPVRVPEDIASAERSPDRGTPCTMVILGASGDLTRRKLIPALFHLMNDGLLADDFHVIGVGRGTMTDQAFRDKMREAVYEEFASPEHRSWERFADRLQYVAGDLADRSTYSRLRDRLAEVEAEPDEDSEPRGRLFYLALPPGVYESTLVHLSDSQLAPRIDDASQRPWVRIVIEKPFGHSLQSAQTLNRMIHMRFAEHQIFRIDHYLGKETVQNLLVFRFANSIFEPVWNRDHVAHVQITAAESVGVEHRAEYYEQAGIFRDMVQNHLLQLLALTAMEPPAVFRAEAVRTEKIKVLDAIRLGHGDIESNVVTGQYGAGTIAGKLVTGYHQEPAVAADSTTPTYAALRLFIDNWRWQGVPFFLRSGKRLPRRATEIAIRFRQPPHVMFANAQGTALSPNLLTFRLQPDEGISLCFEVKAPDHDLRMVTSTMDFSYARAFGPSSHSAYETLLVDCMLGDATLFTRSDGVEAAWRVVDPIIAAASQLSTNQPTAYPAGEWGPPEADALIASAGAQWREPVPLRARVG